MPKYALALTTETLDLAEFLNGGVRPLLEEKPTSLVFEIDAPNEITTDIKHTLELFGEDPKELLVIIPK